MADTVKLGFLSGSTRAGSYNEALARAATTIAAEAGHDSVFIDLADYDMPLYDGDLEAADGPPDATRRLREELLQYRGVFIACPEYNSSITPLLKNTLDWLSRISGEPDVFRTRVFALGGASPGRLGASRSLLTVRQVLAVGLGALVIPNQLAVPGAADAFDGDGRLKSADLESLLMGVVAALADAARRFAA